MAMIATLAGTGIANSPTIWAFEGNTPRNKECVFNLTEVYKAGRKSTEISLADIKERIADLSQKYGLDYDQLYTVIKCESSFKPQFGDGGKAFGLAQFHKKTFNNYCEGDYYDSFDQLDCMAKMFSQGGAANWTCFTKLYTKVIFHKAGAETAYNK